MWFRIGWVYSQIWWVFSRMVLLSGQSRDREEARHTPVEHLYALPRRTGTQDQSRDREEARHTPVELLYALPRRTGIRNQSRDREEDRHQHTPAC